MECSFIRCSQVVIMLSAFLTACGHFSGPQKSNFKDTELHHLNPAPSFMSPVSVAPGEDEINPLHIQSKADYHFTLAEAFSLEGRTAKAIEEFKLAQVYDQSSLVIRLRIAAEYSKLGLLSEALELTNEVLLLDPKNLKALMLQGSLYSALKMYEKSFELFDQVAVWYPDQLDAHFLSGALLAELERYNEAVKRLEKLAIHPENKEPEKTYFYLGRLFIERKDQADTERAKKYLKKAYELKPSWEDPLLSLAQLLQSDQKEQEAVVLLEKHQETQGPSVEVAQALTRIYLAKENFTEALPHLKMIDSVDQTNYNVKIQIALILIEKQQYPEAALQLQQILEIAPDLDKVQYYLGAVFEQMDQGDQAILHYQRVPPRSSYYADAAIHWAHLLHKQDKTKQALEVLSKAVERRSDLPQLYTFSATLLETQKDYQAAILLLKTALVKFPKHIDMHFLLGTLFDRVSQPENTISQMEKVLAIDESHTQALNYLAYTLAELNRDLSRAETLARRAMSLEGQDGFILDTLGWVLFKKGDYVQAVKYLEAAFKLNSEESIIAEHLGDVYYRLELPEKAIKLYNQAASLEKDQNKSKKIEAKIASIENRSFSPARGPASQKQ